MRNLQDIVDVSCGCGAKFESTIVSKAFDGKTLLQRHRLVNSLISVELKAIHAFSMKTYTEAQWRDLRSGEAKEEAAHAITKQAGC